MSATASTASDVSQRGDLFIPWLVLATGCYGLMWLWPGDETIPYHIAWAAFALMYGLGNWTLRRAIAGLAVGTVATGVTFVSRASSGVITWQETAEIPLMSLLMVLMVVHVRRRQLALAAVTVMAERERAQSQDRERLTRLTSHELRTPLTIARGYLELLLAREEDPSQRRDLEVVDDELERLTRVTERLVRVIRLQGDAAIERVDANAVLRQTAERWAPVAPRRWTVEAHAGSYDGSAERLRATLDTLIENALRYTADGDTIRLIGRRIGDRLEIGVADSGSGLSQEQIDLINDAGGEHDDAPSDPLSQTGLGLGLVRGAVAARRGRLVASRSREGGAQLVMELPLDAPIGPFVTEPPATEAPPAVSTLAQPLRPDPAC